MESAFKEKIHNQYIIFKVTEEKYMEGIYDIIKQYKKEVIQQATNEKYLEYAFIFQIYKKRCGRLIEELEDDCTKGNNNHRKEMYKTN